MTQRKNPFIPPLPLLRTLKPGSHPLKPRLLSWLAMPRLYVLFIGTKCNTDLVHRVPWKLMNPPHLRLSRKTPQIGFLRLGVSTYHRKRVTNTPGTVQVLQ